MRELCQPTALTDMSCFSQAVPLNHSNVRFVAPVALRLLEAEKLGDAKDAWACIGVALLEAALSPQTCPALVK